MKAGASKIAMETVFEERPTLIRATYGLAGNLLLWLMFANPMLVGVGVAGSASAAFVAEYFVTAGSSKDAQQDARMDAADSRDKQEDSDRAERRGEMRARLESDEANIRANSDSLHGMMGWGAGAFAAVTVLQIIGLLRKNNDD